MRKLDDFGNVLIPDFSYSLPEDVFEPGEARPTKAKKGKNAKAADSTSKKRTLDDARLDVRTVETEERVSKKRQAV